MRFLRLISVVALSAWLVPNASAAQRNDHAKHAVATAGRSSAAADLKMSTAEVVARLTHDWDGDVRAYDAVCDHIVMMSDAISDGIVKQFPNKFKAS
jgi:hypothetical protein